MDPENDHVASLRDGAPADITVLAPDLAVTVRGNFDAIHAACVMVFFELEMSASDT